MFLIYNEARRVRDDPAMDLRAFLASTDLSKREVEMLLSMLEPEHHEEALVTPSSQNCRGIYSHYLLHLENQHGIEVKNSVDENIADTRRRMDFHGRNPGRASYGLVMGRIQSGKTAHMIGVSLHSMDPDVTEVPYDLVIVLAGLIEDLRVQTLHRFEDSIHGFTGASPKILPNVARDLLSTNEDLLQTLASSIQNLDTNRMVLVVKKNHLVLNALQDLLQNSSMADKRVLIIDDESDYASTDTGEFETEFDTGEPSVDQPSETNRILRAIIKHLNSSSSDCMYLGYTATPFANVLAPESLHSIDSESGLSLFPRDFIHSLQGSALHLDNQHYFAEPDNPNVQTIVAYDGGLVQEQNLIEEAIYRHTVTDIVKKCRGFQSHHTTLIHTSREVDDHRRIAERAKELIDEMKIPSMTDETCDNLLRIARAYNLPTVDLSDCEERIELMRRSRRDYLLELPQANDVIEVNARTREADEQSERNLRYRYGPRSYIAVGGTRLSRGLTLEGLTTSIFVRTSQVPRYDTMMQMSRWCGYRENSSGATYADLVRIITTEDIAGNFRDIAIAEADLRQKIESIPWDETPLEQPEGLWIIETPGMSVTSEDKMQNVRRRTWGRMGTLPIWSYKSPVLSSHNPMQTAALMYQQLHRFIENVFAIGTQTPPSGASNFLLARGIPSDWVLNYLRHYRQMYSIDDSSSTVQNLDRLIDPENWQDTEWTVAIHTPQRNSNTTIGDVNIGLVNRTRRSNQEFVVIATNGGRDIAIDLDVGEIRQNPLLILYLINPASTQQDRGVDRVFDPSVTSPVPAWGICMPQPGNDEGGSEVRGGL